MFCLSKERQKKERRRGSNDLSMHACCASVWPGSKRTRGEIRGYVNFGRIFFCLFKH